MKAHYNLPVLTSLVVALCCTGAQGQTPVFANTTSGNLQGIMTNGVKSFKGIPFAQPPVGALRWEAPVPFTSTASRAATTLAAACTQQFIFATQLFIEHLFNNPPPQESEDCLYLNVWAPSNSTGPGKPVVVWFYGGSLQFGTADLAAYDGTSFAKNQNIVIVTTNYRTNTFGFPAAREIALSNQNLGYMDQDLALQWVQNNIAAFGGDPKQVTIMGQSAGAESVAQMIQRHAVNTPFRAAIMQSEAAICIPNNPDFGPFDTMAIAMNCTQAAGATRFACMKNVSASRLRAWLNGPSGLPFEPIFNNVTAFSNPVRIQRIKDKLTARIPILNGATQDDGTVFTLGQTNLTSLMTSMFGSAISVPQVRAAYPGLSDAQIIPKSFRDIVFVCPAQLHASAFVQSGEPNVFRYTYGAVFPDLQVFPGAGAWHASEILEVFGTFNASSATAAEITLSQTMQTMWANFIKNPTVPPAPNWAPFALGNSTNTLARLAYQGNVQLTNVVQPALSGLDDSPCNFIWNGFFNWQ